MVRTSCASFAARSPPPRPHRTREVEKVQLPPKLPLCALAVSAAAGAAALCLSGGSFAGTAPAARADVSAVTPAAAPTPAARRAAATAATAATAAPSLACLARSICEIKEKIRWRVPAWTAEQCKDIAGAVLASAKRNDVSPTLLLGVMINESDLNDKAVHVTRRDGRVYAKDSGLMGIRCIVDRAGRCQNGHVRGLRWKDLMVPATNIELGAKELARWRQGGAVITKVVKVRGPDGHVRPVTKNLPCHHTDHAYWAHYNHGPRYISRGFARHYPHRVAVLDHAVAAVLNVDAPELRAGRITIHDPGRRARTPDTPLEPRYKKLCEQIGSVNSCSAIASLN
jgi:hypothetical protein